MSDPRQHHALIIEDEMMIALSLEQLLTGLGFRSFDIADSAVACAREHRPDLSTADGRIKGGTGMEAVDQITDAIGRVPVVYVTGNPGLLVDRADPVVTKPFSSEALS